MLFFCLVFVDFLGGGLFGFVFVWDILGSFFIFVSFLLFQKEIEKEELWS